MILMFNRNKIQREKISTDTDVSVRKIVILKLT